MRKYLLIAILAVLTIILFVIMNFGIKLGKFTLINSYKDIENENLSKNKLITELNEKNNADFSEKQTALTIAVQEYNMKKAMYDKSVEAGEISNGDIYNSMDVYDVDALCEIIGSYAKTKGVLLDLKVEKSATSTAITPDYVMADLQFEVSGEYIGITDFIYSLEDDDTLSFEINNFYLEKGKDNLKATFLVKEIALNNKNK